MPGLTCASNLLTRLRWVLPRLAKIPDFPRLGRMTEEARRGYQDGIRAG